MSANEPVWRQDFPLTSAGEDEVTRREFVRYLVLASGGFAAGNVGIALWSSLRTINEGAPRPIVDLARVPEGSAHLFKYPTDADPAILVHLPGGELRAFSQKCTHLGCVVYYEAEKGEEGVEPDGEQEDLQRQQHDDEQPDRGRQLPVGAGAATVLAHRSAASPPPSPRAASAHTVPSRTSTSIRPRGRCGGPDSTSPVAA